MKPTPQGVRSGLVLVAPCPCVGGHGDAWLAWSMDTHQVGQVGCAGLNARIEALFVGVGDRLVAGVTVVHAAADML